MLDIVDITVKDYNRNIFYHQSTEVIKDILSRKKFPVIVGGTNYYIETLLFNQKIPEILQKKLEIEKEHELQEIMNKPLQQRYEYLKKLDPLITNKIHKND